MYISEMGRMYPCVSQKWRVSVGTAIRMKLCWDTCVMLLGQYCISFCHLASVACRVGMVPIPSMRRKPTPFAKIKQIPPFWAVEVRTKCRRKPAPVVSSGTSLRQNHGGATLPLCKPLKLDVSQLAYLPRAEFCLTTQHLLGGGSDITPPPPK